MTSNTERNALIIEYAETKDYSFQLIADLLGVSRNTVAGVVFRNRVPCSARVSSPHGSKNKLGCGYHGAGPWATYTARTHQVDPL